MQRRVLITVQAMVMNYAVGLPTVGGFGDVHTLVDLAVAAERHGWDGVHLWDHVLYHESGWPVASPVAPGAFDVALEGATPRTLRASPSISSTLRTASACADRTIWAHR
jgi:alkanesulfonate monooxygenase SsuD/methylene tetrahydromethanopterin reductase-like flavin-dependent oxidoreductase (luciferase family)